MDRPPADSAWRAVRSPRIRSNPHLLVCRSARQVRGPMALLDQQDVASMHSMQTGQILLRLPVHAAAQHARLSAAQFDLGAGRIAHDELEAAAEPRDDRFDVVQIDQA